MLGAEERRMKEQHLPESQLAYKIELAASGLRDGPHGLDLPSTTERLNRVRALRDAWTRLEFNEPLSYTLPFTRHNEKAYRYAAGVLARGSFSGKEHPTDEEMDEYNLYGDYSCFSYFDTGPPRPEHHTQLCVSECLAGPPFESVVDYVGIPYAKQALALDPSQDLVVFVDLAPGPELNGRRETMIARVYLRKFSAPSEAHPDGHHGDLILEMQFIDDDDLYSNMSLEVTDDVVGLWVSSEVDGRMWITIWNWKTSEELVVGAFAECVTQANLGLTSFILTACEEGDEGIWLYEFGGEQRSHHERPATLVARLQLPPIRSKLTTQDISVSAGTWFARIPDGAPFGVDNADRLYAFVVTYSSKPHVVIIIRGHTLQRVIEETRTKDRKDVPFQSWLLSGSHILRFRQPKNYYAPEPVQCVHGQRVLFATRKGGLTIADFSTRPNGAKPTTIGIGQHGRFIDATALEALEDVYKAEAATILRERVQMPCYVSNISAIGNIERVDAVMLGDSEIVTVRKDVREDPAAAGR
ncbi:hypothetical protein K488DRAFT_74601 [Vararia minispora EC-137]|uniref:Uncharacterized protein n=1 Tax=Vararia minispora EC-137 TaxID=1314806 RepID=A0ACB8Q6G5_9AGAM|nr:hypothetical protein K488DRAFT_74601 [Vararia minispora EC-137]